MTNNDFTDDLLNQGYTKGYKQGRKDAIEEFMEHIEDDICCDCTPCGSGCRLVELREIAKKLKEKKNE